jgi:tRNA(fMet)-specific endonuclease VapC
LGYPDLNKEEETIFNLLINNSILQPVDSRVINKTIEIKQKNRIKLPDALIAATCLVNKLEILTLNIKDFQNIKGLTIFSI